MIRKELSSIPYIAFLITLFFVLNTGCNGKTLVKTSVAQTQAGFDQALAEKWGADEYGMKKYVMALLKSGPNRSQDAGTRAKLQRAHLDNISRLAEEGKLILAGPFLDNGEIRGIYLFNVETIGAAEQLTRTDPAIQAGTLIMELHPWYGSAALMEINERHSRIAKKKI